MSEKDSPPLPYTFKFENPPIGTDPIVYFRREIERVVEYTNDHLLQIRQKVQDIEDGT